MKKEFYFGRATVLWAAVLFFCLVQQGLAQDTVPPAPSKREVRVKGIKTGNGQTRVMDTTFTISAPAHLPDVLRFNRPQGLEGRPGARTHKRLLSGPDSLAGTLPGLLRLHPGMPAGQLDSVKVIYFKKGHRAGDTILIKAGRVLIISGPGGLRIDSLQPGPPLFLPEGPRQIFIADSLLRMVEAPGHLGKLEQDILVILESGDVMKDADGKKEQGLAPATSVQRIVIIQKRLEDLKAPAEKRKPQKIGQKDVSGLREDLKFRNFRYYPNPSKGRFALDLESGKTGTLTIQVLDAGRRVIHEETFQNFSGRLHQQIDISGHKSGIYFLRILQGDSYLTRKVILK
jgi:hypothetical protein